MKKNILLIALLFSCSFYAQVTKISSLSSSKFLDSKIIYEDNNEDVFGYLLLFEKDKTNPDETSFELALLDKNLNKVGTTTFTQETYNSWLFKLDWSLYYAKKNKDNLYIAIVQSLKSMEGFMDNIANDKGTIGFRILNLKDFKISNNYSIKNYVFKEQVGKLDIKSASKFRKELEGANFAKLIKNNGFLVSDIDYMEAMMASFSGKANSKSQVPKTFYFFDLDFKQKWTYKLNENNDSRSYYKYSYYDGDGNDIVFMKNFYEKSSDYISDVSFELVNAQTGKKEFEISLADTDKTLKLDDFQFQNDKIVLFASVYDFNKKGEAKQDKKRGYVKITFDRATGKQISKDYFYWDAFAGKLDINEFGKIKDYGYIHFLEFKSTSDGKTIAIAEGYKPEKNTKILDLFTFVFDDKMKLLEFKKIEKFKNKLKNVESYGELLQYYGFFDYMYSQKLPGGGFVFYYSDNEKEGTRAAKDPKWILGVITYIDGVFDYQKVPLTTKDGQIYPLKAKNGYVLLKEVPNKQSEKDSEFRLEKINY